MKIVLASGSPRRRELLSLITENFAVCPADADESLRDGAPLADEVVRLSRLKAEAAMQSHPDAVCIGSDTMVTIDHLPLGKPKDRADAADMLRRLRGRTHEVLTGLAVLSPDGGAQTLCTRTEVTFRDFSEEELEEYLATGEPLDKAGAYGIQGHGALLIEGIGGVFGRGIGYFTEFDELKAENEELKKQLRENEQLVRDAQLAIEENNRFRAQAGQPERQRNLTTVNAEVISRNPGDTAVTLTLDKGTAHGVAKGDLVTTIDGMVGYVSEAGSNTCEVTTVTDVDMQCGALITRTRETAIAEGSYDLMSEDRLRLSYLTAGNQVVVGDTVETSGRGGAFPKGIMIGTVESVQPEETGISYYAVLRPFVNVSNVSSVSIITDFTDTTE